MNDNNDKKPWQDTIKWEYDSARQRESIYKQTLTDLAANKKAQKYFRKYDPSSIAAQIDSYAWRKAKWMVNKEQNEWCLEFNGLQTPLAAQTCLGNIQQKKLFDKQCLWRAEMFQHPAIETTSDFNHWEHNILNCPFIEPVSEDDIALYIRFLNEYLGENLAFLGSWQDYNSYNSNHATVIKMMQEDKEDKEDANDEEDEEEMYGEEDEYDDEDDEKQPGSLMPPWYLFVNQYRDDAHYLLLPDKRQEKEWFYSRKAHAEQVAEATERQKINPPDRRPYFHLFQKEEIENFINQVEDNPEEIINAYRVHEKLYNDPEEEKNMYWVKEAWEELKDCLEPFPIAAGISDWKKALIKTAKQWKNTKIARALPMHYDEYLFRRSAGIASPFDADQEATYRRMANDYKESILRGRELSGEPRDLNF